MPPAGGASSAFRPRDTFATSLQSAGYMTALMGKYLNGYRPLGQRPAGLDVVGRRRRGLREVRLHPARQAAGRPRLAGRYGYKPRRLPDRRDLPPRPGLRRPRGQGPPAVPARAVDLHAARAVHARAARRASFAGAHRAAQLAVRRAAARASAPTWLSPAPLSRGADRRPRRATSACACSPCRRSTADRRPARAAAAARAAREHLHRLQLRQRLPHGRASAAPGQADRVRPRHPRAADRRRARRARGHDGLADGGQRRPAADVPGARRARSSGPQVEGRSLVPFLRGRAPAAGATRS